jgi:catechol 2,3-dioxygenase-like lactoylglutathione lyase family enzyme
MIDHISYAVSDYARSRAFYDAVLAPLGYRPMMEFDQVVGYGTGHGPQFWISAGAEATAAVGPGHGFHIAFRAPDRAAIDAFYRAALATGGRDNGAPGLREHYHPDYYAAFVFDPDGYRIEAVCHRPHS